METKAVNGGRIRKVTITEIENEQEWNWPEEEQGGAVMTKTTDEIFGDLDEVVQDWKKKLESIIADGLKTIKKTTKEKKTMMKYLPGDSLIGGSGATLEARRQILTEWKDDMKMAIDKTHRNLNNLGNEKVKQTIQAVNGLVPEDEEREEKQNDCTTLSLDFETLMKDLDLVYQKYNMNSYKKVPIYNVQNDLFPMKNAPFPWWKSVATYNQLIESGQFNNPKRSSNVLSILQDFVSEQKSQKSIMEEWKRMEEAKKKHSLGNKEIKKTRRGRDSVQKMKERREIRKYKQFLLREIVRKGETHYYLMKKEINEPDNMEVEDIFADWSKNFAEVKKPKAVRPRVRKISHRAERKEMIKEELKRDDQHHGPKTYAQMLRKNLKIPVEGPQVEEIFGPWMKNVEKMYKPLKPSNAAEDVDVFTSWNFIFEDAALSASGPPLASLECGQPTVMRAASKKQSVEKLSARLRAEGYPLGHSTDTTVALRNNKTQLVPFVETKPGSKLPAASDFKPSQHAQRCVLVNDIPAQTFIGPMTKPRIPTPPPMPSFNWKELLHSASDQSGRGEAATKSYKTEEIFDQWRHIFIDANKEAPKTKKRTVLEYKQDLYFMEWLRNLDEPIVVKKKVRKGSEGSDDKTPSPTPSKREEKKLMRSQFIEDDVTEMKNNRRQDFAKAKKIKDKKRTEASRNSLGKRVK